MSDFKFSCPACGQHVVCDTSNAGMQIPCPICGAMLTVPAPPPTAPAVGTPVPGRLTINKSAHQQHSPPPSSAPKAPVPQTSYGAKIHGQPVRAKKKSPLVPIGIAAGVLVVAAVAWFAIIAPQLQKREQAKIAAQKAAEEQQKAAAKAAAEEAKKKAKPTWKLDLANAIIPDLPAGGKHHGADFTVENAIFERGALVLLQTSGSPRQFVIAVPIKPGETIAGKDIEVTAKDTNNVPRVLMNWKADPGKPPGMEMFAKGYAMKLQFGTPDNGHIPGKIYLSLPDPDQSFVAGKFQIGPKPGTPAAAAPTAAAQPPPPQRQPGRGGPLVDKVRRAHVPGAD